MKSVRQQNALFGITKDTKGLEVGPLHNALAPKKEGYNIDIIDHCSKEDLLKKYKGHPIDLNAIEDVDYIWNGKSYAETIGKNKHYDYVIASHVIEHTPDLIGFLLNLEEILKDDGVISLVIPDKRYCFDFFRPLTGIGKIIDAYLNKDTFQTIGTITEYYLNVIKNGDLISWDTYNKNKNMAFVHPFSDIDKEILRRKNNEYVDVHSWVFTPHSFRLLIHDLYTLGYIPFQEIAFFETNGCEFYMTIGKLSKKNHVDRMAYLEKIHSEISHVISQNNEAKIIHPQNRLKNIAKTYFQKILNKL